MKLPRLLAEDGAEGNVLILGWAVGIGVILLAAFAAVDVPPSSGLGPSPGSGDSGIS